MTKYQKAKLFAKKLSTMSISQIKRKYNVIGEGSARIVIQYSKTIAIKVAKGRKGTLQNMAESDIYRYRASDRLKKHLATIYDEIWEDNTILALIVRYYPNKVYRLTSKNNKKEYYKCANMLNILDIGDNNRPSSYRRTSTKLIIVDYGFDDDAKTYYRNLWRKRRELRDKQQLNKLRGRKDITTQQFQEHKMRQFLKRIF